MASIRKPIFADVLSRFVNLYPASRLEDLGPWWWVAERPVNRPAR
jgi:hypothetical protein